jgi:hypothetical protein
MHGPTWIFWASLTPLSLQCYGFKHNPSGLVMPNKNTVNGQIDVVTSGTCTVGSCSSSRGATQCINSACHCAVRHEDRQ